MKVDADPVRYRFGEEHVLREALSVVVGDGRLVSEPAEQGRWRLYDTFDWRLWHRGWRLLGVADDHHTVLVLRDRDELVLGRAIVAEMPDFAWEMRDPALRRLAAVIEPRRLLPLAELEMRYERSFVCNPDDEPELRCTVARAVAAGAEGGAGDLGWFLTLSPLRGRKRGFRIAAAALLESFGPPTTQSVDDAALVAAGLRPGSYGAKMRYPIHRDMRADVALKAICRTLLETMEFNVDGLVADVDVEFLHDFRVAVRRTRSALSALRTVFPPAEMEHFRAEFKWLGDETGEGRDLDVWGLELRKYKRDLPAFAAEGLDPLAAFLEDKRKLAYESIRAALASDRYARLVADWRDFLEQPCPGLAEHNDAMLPIGEVAAARIWKAYRRLAKRGRTLDPDGPVEPLHELRIDGKKLRYLMAFFAGLFADDEVGPLQPPLKALQDVLGTLNDLFVQQNSLRAFAHEMQEAGCGEVDAMLAIGRLSQVLTLREEQTRGRFVEVFRRVARGEAARAYRRLFKPLTVLDPRLGDRSRGLAGRTAG